jgi:hypothetical protein
MRWVEHVAPIAKEKWNGFWVRKREGKRPFGRPSHKGKEHVKLHFQDTVENRGVDQSVSG